MKGFTRPEPSVLPEAAVVPERNVISPAPDQFTHEVIRTQPFYYMEARRGRTPDGELPAGTRVVLLVHDGGPFCRVADGRGLYVETRFDGLRRL